ncbi:hypothetical protein [Aquamicrobium soli]|uniref:Uncharacterized protein n=1 Tax=Aquamicrobium soli TaxID=1811518 RepID=A0ABV7KDM4_9HYPH
MIRIDERKLDEWLNSYEEFNYAFRAFCFAHFRVHNVHADFVPNVIRQVHEQWVSDNNQWLTEEADEATTTLSHVKILSLLLYNLSSESFLGNLYNHDYDEEEKYTFKGTDQQKYEARRDLIDGRESVLAMDFCIMIIDWFERNRIDRFEPYRQRLTKDMRHDLLNYLLSGACERKALYLILKALYLRSGGGHAN